MVRLYWASHKAFLRAMRWPTPHSLAAAGASHQPWPTAPLVHMLLPVALAIALLAITSATALAQRQVQQATVAEVTERIAAALSQVDLVNDPLVTLPNGVQAKRSNVEGIDIKGARYYYQLRYHMSSDPLSRGAAKRYRPVALIDPNTSWEVLIYRIP